MADLGDVRRVDRSGDAEVGDLHSSIWRDQQVSRFDVAVDDADTVGSTQRLGRLVEDRHDFAKGHGIASREAIRQWLTVDELHHQEREALPTVVNIFGIVLGIVVDVRDPRVRQPGGEAGLNSEPPAKVLRIDQVRAKELDRDRAPENLIGRLPHLSHPADRDPVIQHIP